MTQRNTQRNATRNPQHPHAKNPHTCAHLYVGRLRRRPARVVAAEPPGVPPPRQARDERPHVDRLDAPPVLRPDLDAVPDCHDALAAVPGHLIVHPGLDRLQQRRLAVEPAPDDDGDASLDPHPPDPPRVRRLEGDGEGLWGLERQGGRRRHRQVRGAGRAGEDGAVGDEGDEAAGRQLRAEGLGVLGGLHR